MRVKATDRLGITAEHTTREPIAVCEEMDIPVAELRTIDNLHEHAQVTGTGLFRAMHHPSEGEIVAIRPTALFARPPATIDKDAPRVGEDTGRLLQELGFPADFLA